MGRYHDISFLFRLRSVLNRSSDIRTATSTSLLQRACADDEVAWERLCRLFGPTIYRSSRQLGLNAEDAADIVQEVFAVVARRLGTFDYRAENSTFRGWLYVITRNKVRDLARLRDRRLITVAATDAKLDLNLCVEPDVAHECNDASETARIVARALGLIQIEFEHLTWRAFHRVAIDGSVAIDVAEELSMSVGAVYKAKSRVLQRLRRELEGLI